MGGSRFFAPYGVETIPAATNPLISHAYTFLYDPFTHTGLLTTTRLSPTWSVKAGLAVGSDLFFNPADVVTFIGGFTWARPDGTDQVQVYTIAGPGRFNTSRQVNNPNILDLVWTHKIHPRLTYNFESLAGYQDNVPGIGSAHWWGVIQYLGWDFTPRLNGTTRLEFFDDLQGQRTGFVGLYTAATAGLTFKPRPWLLLRSEVRYDHNDRSRPFDDRHDLFTAAADVIVRW